MFAFQKCSFSETTCNLGTLNLIAVTRKVHFSEKFASSVFGIETQTSF